MADLSSVGSEGGGGGGSTYDEFLSEMESEVHEIFRVGKGKLAKERKYLAGEMAVPTGAGNANFLFNDRHLGDPIFSDPAPGIKLVKEFAKFHCFDLTAVKASIEDVVHTNKILDDNYKDKYLLMADGLHSWTEHENPDNAAKVFKDKYLKSMDVFYKRQGIALDHYYQILVAIAALVEANRKALRHLLEDAKQEMSDYSPFWGVTNPWLSWNIELAVIAVPEALPEVEGAAMITQKAIETVAEKLIDKGKEELEADESVAGIIIGLEDGIQSLMKNSNDAFDNVSGFASQFMDTDTPERNVMACPQ